MSNRPQAVPTRPQDLIRILDSLIEHAENLKAEVRWVHSVSYGRNPGPDSERVRSTGVSDPTGSLVVNQQHIRAHYRRAAGLIVKGNELLDRSGEALKTAIDSADKVEDFRDPEGEYGRRMTEPSATKQEVQRARELQKRRMASGLGFGEG